MVSHLFRDSGGFIGLVAHNTHNSVDTFFTSTVPAHIRSVNREVGKVGHVLGVFGNDLRALVQAARIVIRNDPLRYSEIVSPEVAALVEAVEKVKEEFIAFDCAVEELVWGFLARLGDNEGIDYICQKFHERLASGIQHLKQTFPPLDQASGHEGRKKVIGGLLDTIEEVIVHLAREFGLFDETFEKYASKVKEMIGRFLVALGLSSGMNAKVRIIDNVFVIRRHMRAIPRPCHVRIDDFDHRDQRSRRQSSWGVPTILDSVK